MTTPAPSPPPLTPFPLDVLLGRIVHEWETRSRIFDLPTARFWSPDPAVDLSFSFLGRRAATPIGPAAGPHSQMAQNIILAWLGGARLFELKTVQVLDELVINRPCIDMQTIGYNIEWSQELTVAASLDEYVKGWMAIHLLRQWEPLREHIGPDPGTPRLRHVGRLRPGRDFDRQSGRIHRRIEGRQRVHRPDATLHSRSFQGDGRPRLCPEDRRQRHPLNFPWMPSRGDRPDHPASDDAARSRRDRQAQPDPPRVRRC